MTIRRGMILAAGMGKRLLPITETLPKAMVEVGGRPLIEHSVLTLARAGITDIIINLHHLGHMIRDHLGNGSSYGVNLSYSVEDPLQGSGGGILAARHLLGTGAFVALNADTIVDIDLGRVIAFHEDKRAAATLVLRKDPQMESYGLIRTGADGRVQRFLDTSADGHGAGSNTVLEAFMFSGVQVLGPRVFDYMPVGQAPFSITRATYPAMLVAGERLFGYRFDGPWKTVGTHAELQAAR